MVDGKMKRLLFHHKIRHDHAVVAVAGGDDSAADRDEMAGRVEMVDPQDRETALEGVAPAGAGGGEGIDEIAGELAVDDVGGGSVEIAAEDRWHVGEIGGPLKDVQGERELLLADDPVVPVVGPRGSPPQAQVGGGGGEVDVDDLDFGAAGVTD